jgi:hypothetical protein
MDKKIKSTSSRAARLEDFFDDSDDINNQSTKNNKYNKNHSHNDNTIAKNQQEFGHRKRIKP